MRRNIRVWTAEIPNRPNRYLAAFNLDDGPEDLDLAWKDVGIPTQTVAVRDLWRRADLGKLAALSAKLALHASLLYRISPVA